LKENILRSNVVRFLATAAVALTNCLGPTARWLRRSKQKVKHWEGEGVAMRVCIHDRDFVSQERLARNSPPRKSSRRVTLSASYPSQFLLSSCRLYSFFLYLSFFCSLTRARDKRPHTHIGIMSGESAGIYRHRDVFEAFLWVKEHYRPGV
jgi:hypothetical protein